MIAVFFAARLCALVFQLGGGYFFGKDGVFLFMMLIPTILYIAVPVASYKYRVFGIKVGYMSIKRQLEKLIL
jgi:hypothetical protein